MYLRIGDEVYTIGKQLFKKLSKEIGSVSRNKHINVVGDVSKGEQTRATDKMLDIKRRAYDSLPQNKKFTSTSKEFQKEFDKQYIRDVRDSIDEAVGAGFLETQLQKESIAGLTASKLVGKGSGKDIFKKRKLKKFLRSGPRKMKRGGRVGKPKGVGAAQRGYGKAMKRGK